MLNDRKVDGTAAAMEGLDHLNDSLATLAGHCMLVKEGQFLELADHLTEYELRFVMLLDLASFCNIY